jgi:hypothetical protein
MPSETISRGNLLHTWMIAPTLASTGGLTPNSSQEIIYAVPGVQINDAVDIYPISAGTAGVTQGYVRVSSAGNVAIQFANGTASTLSITPGQIVMIINRPETPISLLPPTAA